MSVDRLSRDNYFMEIAKTVSKRSTCPRLQVGAVLVKKKSIVATGYNGSPHGLPHCEEVGCLMMNEHCIRTIHAEVNCILQALEHSIGIDGSTLYVTSFPCFQCLKLLSQSGVSRIVYTVDYDDELNHVFAVESGMLVERLKG
jgi:dCMP deaminase